MSDAIADNGAGDVWYFSIGAMMNPTSLKGRGLVPVESVPAELMDFELGFFGPAGMAAAIATPEKSFHGVLHRMTAPHMVVLDKIETGYIRTPAQARLYDGSMRDCSVYTENKEGNKIGDKSPDNKPPAERYIDILCEGCAHFGVKPEYVEWLRSQPFVPRKPPEELLTFDVPADTPTWTLEDVARGGSDEGPPFYWAINGKVLEYTGPPNGTPYQFVKNTYAGRDIAFPLSQILYDPKHGLPSSPAEVTQERKNELEDHMASGFMAGMNKVVGVL